MLKKLLGKEELEEQIRSLEQKLEHLHSENESLMARLGTREETTRRAVSQKQVAEEELNSARKKIETMEHELTTLRQTAIQEISFRAITTIPWHRLDRYLSPISSIRARDKSLITAYLRPGETLSDLSSSHELISCLEPETVTLIEKLASTTGIILFYDTSQMVREVVAPFLPLETSCWQADFQFNIRPLQHLMDKEMTLLVMLLHAGESFLGMTSSPDSFMAHQIVRSSVKGKHTKGGWSQRRFEKLRDEDIQHHLDKVRDALRSLISGADIDLVVAGGDTRLLSEIAHDLQYPVIERGLDVSVDRKQVDRILKETWSSKRYQL